MKKEEKRRTPEKPHWLMGGGAPSFAARSSRGKRRFEWFSLVKQAFEPRFKYFPFVKKGIRNAVRMMGKGRMVRHFRFSIYDFRFEIGEWIMVNGDFLSRITQIMRMARIGEREGLGTRFAGILRVIRLDFKKTFGTIIPNFSLPLQDLRQDAPRGRKRMVNGEW